MLIGSGVLNSANYLLRGQLVLLAFTGPMVVLMVGLAVWLRRGGSVPLVTSVLLSTGVCVASLLGITAGASGLSSLAWIITAAPIALAFGGQRAGWATLGLSLVFIVVGVVGIHGGWLLEHATPIGPSAQALGLIGASVVAFMVARAYDQQQRASLVALEQARAEAEAASRAKGDFVATVSHELRTPLHGVTGLLALLRDEADPARRAELMAMADQSAAMLLAVVNDVLDFSKIEAGQLELERIPLRLADELAAVRRVLAPRAEAAGVTLAVEVAPEVPAWLVGDPTRLRQVVLNLLSNALKFTAQGEVRCSVAVASGRLVVQVKDTGIGMPAEVLGRLFTPFTQGDSSTTRRFGGTGLGLAICQRLVGAMGGAISVESAPGQGACFTVDLPCVTASAPATATATATATAEATGGRAPRRVLVVEDNQINQVVVTRLLERRGHAVQLAGNGAEALEALGAGRYDLVLMDVHMPVMDGFEATRAMRARGDRTPVVALTAGVTNQDHARCLAAGMSEVLAKPLRLDRLDALLAALPRAAA